MVFYRKYRSQTIDELDNATVRKTLPSVLKGGNPPHAFLFTGPKGLGKTSTARIIAKALNCTGRDRKNDIEPCNVCEQCVSITNGTNMDILEIDAASNRGIDEIRDLKEKIRLAPLTARKKVYIIDEVHMLTTEAFNALLKTLEEPPDHAVFILCTTEPHKIPSTILSRCFHISFTLATEDELVRAFERVAKGEKLSIDKEALFIIARLAEGGFRDGVKILEELALRANGEKISKEFVEKNYHVQSISGHLHNFIVALVTRDAKKGLLTLQQISGSGIDIKYFLQALIESLHEHLLSLSGVEGKAQNNDLTQFSVEEIMFLLELLSKAYTDMKYAVIPQLPLELVLLEFCNIEREKGGKAPVSSPSLQKETVSLTSLRQKVGTLKKIQALYGEKPAEKKGEKQDIAVDTLDLMKASPGEITHEWMELFWKNIISEMKTHNHTVAGVLRGCSIKSYDKKRLVIETTFKFHKERIDDIKTRDALARVCKMLTGNDVEIAVELKA